MCPLENEEAENLADILKGDLIYSGIPQDFVVLDAACAQGFRFTLRFTANLLVR